MARRYDPRVRWPRRVAIVLSLTTVVGVWTNVPSAWPVDATPPAVTLARASGNRVRLTWTGVPRATIYRWSIRTCNGVVVRSGETARRSKRARSFARSGCYEGWVLVLFSAGEQGATGRARLAPGASKSTPLPPLPPPDPEGLVDDRLIGIAGPTDLAFTPDGRMLITGQAGTLHVLGEGASEAVTALELGARTCTDNSRGLLGVEVDPNFASTKAIYLFYTFTATGACPDSSPDSPVNRVSRFVLGDDNVIAASSEQLVLDGIPSPHGHNGGDLVVDPAGFIFASVGDGFCDLADPTRCRAQNTNARSLALPLGKVLRVRLDGSVPADNPFVAVSGSRRCAAPTGPQPGNGPCQETWVTGLRNPFRIARRPSDGAVFINDVGQAHWEEINIAFPRADFGWNLREGPCVAESDTNCPPPPPGFTDPTYSYPHTDGCRSITGGTFAPTAWPAPYGGSYLFADFVCGSIFRLVDTNGTFSRQPLITGLGSSSAVSMITGPFEGGQAVYYTTYANGGEVHRLQHTGTP